MIRKTSAMVEAGILAAIAIVMALIGFYIPLMNIVGFLLWPLPFIVCTVRHGLKWSTMSIVVAGTLIAMLIGPLNAVGLVFSFGLIGLVTGETMRRHCKPLIIIFYSSITAVVAILINVGLSIFILHINPIELMVKSMEMMVSPSNYDRFIEFLRNNNVAAETITQIKTMFETSSKEFIKFLKIVLPAGFIGVAPILALCNYLVAQKIFTKLGVKFEPLPPFYNWQCPGWVIVPYGISLLGVTFLHDNSDFYLVYQILANVQALSGLVLIAQGIVIIYWFVDNQKKPKLWANLAVLSMFIIPLMSYVILYLGAYDILFDFRKIRPESVFKLKQR